MASKTWRPSVALKESLLREPHSFSFFQVIRLITMLDRERQGKRQVMDSRPLSKVRPELSLSFPPADVASIEKTSKEGRDSYLVTATFLGLYGVSSPMPTFYTEDLLEEAAEDETVTRDFIDIFNQPLYDLLYATWTKYRLYLKLVEEQDESIIERLFSILGLGNETLRRDIPEEHRLLRYLGLVTQHPHSALSLKTILSDALDRIPVEILSCIPRMAEIPPDQRSCLGVSGSTIGRDTFIGTEIMDRGSKFRIKIGPLTKKQFQELLPGGEKHSLVVFLTDFYVSGALIYDLELLLAPGEMVPVQLGDPESSMLGWNTWVYAGEGTYVGKVVFEPQRPC